MPDFPDGEFDPCPLDQPCENCGHLMRGHFRAGRGGKGYGWSCGACRCENWCCPHGGVRTLIPLEELDA